MQKLSFKIFQNIGENFFDLLICWSWKMGISKVEGFHSLGTFAPNLNLYSFNIFHIFTNYDTLWYRHTQTHAKLDSTKLTQNMFWEDLLTVPFMDTIYLERFYWNGVKQDIGHIVLHILRLGLISKYCSHSLAVLHAKGGHVCRK